MQLDKTHATVRDDKTVHVTNNNVHTQLCCMEQRDNDDDVQWFNVHLKAD